MKNGKFVYSNRFHFLVIWIKNKKNMMALTRHSVNRKSILNQISLFSDISQYLTHCDEYFFFLLEMKLCRYFVYINKKNHIILDQSKQSRSLKVNLYSLKQARSYSFVQSVNCAAQSKHNFLAGQCKINKNQFCVEH